MCCGHPGLNDLIIPAHTLQCYLNLRQCHQSLYRRGQWWPREGWGTGLGHRRQVSDSVTGLKQDNYVYVWLLTTVCWICCRYPRRPEEGAGSCGTGVVRAHVRPWGVGEGEREFSARAVSPLIWIVMGLPGSHWKAPKDEMRRNCYFCGHSSVKELHLGLCPPTKIWGPENSKIPEPLRP